MVHFYWPWLLHNKEGEEFYKRWLFHKQWAWKHHNNRKDNLGERQKENKDRLARKYDNHNWAEGKHHRSRTTKNFNRWHKALRLMVMMIMIMMMMVKLVFMKTVTIHPKSGTSVWRGLQNPFSSLKSPKAKEYEKKKITKLHNKKKINEKMISLMIRIRMSKTAANPTR